MLSKPGYFKGEQVCNFSFKNKLVYTYTYTHTHSISSTDRCVHISPFAQFPRQFKY